MSSPDPHKEHEPTPSARVSLVRGTSSQHGRAPMRVVMGAALVGGLLLVGSLAGLDFDGVVEASRGDREGLARSTAVALAPATSDSDHTGDRGRRAAGVDGVSTVDASGAERLVTGPGEGEKPQTARNAEEGPGLHEGLESLLEELSMESEAAAERWLRGGIQRPGSAAPPLPWDPFALGGDEGADETAIDGPPEDGEWVQNSEGRVVEHGRYADGQREGTWRSYHPNGSLELQREYSNGELDGLWVKYYSNGDVREQGVFLNGLREGVWHFYDRFGVSEGRSGIYVFGAKID